MPVTLQATNVPQSFGMLIGRIFMSAIFIWSGYGKLIAAAGTKAYFVSLGLPLPDVAWIVTVLVEFVGGLALLLGIRVRLIGFILALWCIATAMAGHSNFAVAGNDVQFMKNVALCGGFIYIALFGGGRYTLEEMFGKRSR